MEYEELYKWKKFKSNTILKEIERQETEELDNLSFEELVVYASERSEEGCRQLKGEIEFGSQGDNVILIQAALIKIGYVIRKEEHGVFGSDTLVSILKLQKSKGIRPDGCVGRKTARFLTQKIRKSIEKSARTSRRGAGGNTGETNSHFEEDPTFSYEERGNGWVTVNPSWILKNIVMVPLSGGRKARLHRVVAQNFQETYAKAVEVSGYEPKSIQTFATRHIGRDESKPLSLHTYGIAVDFDPQENPMGGKGSILTNKHPFVQTFRKAGWIWGGNWRIRDDMHFEFNVKNL